MGALILAVSVALIVSFFCSIMEAMLYSVPWSYIELLRTRGHTAGRLLFQLRSSIEKPISALLTLNTIANTAGAAVSGAAAVHVFGSRALGVFTAIFTILIFLLAEILPKTLGVTYCRQLAPVLARPLYYLVWLLAPVIWITGYIARLFQASKKTPHTTEEDIAAVASLTRQSGVIQPYEETAIKNILSLDKKTVRDIMTPRTVVFSLPADMTVSQAVSDPMLSQFSRIPIYEDEHEDIVGILHRRNLLQALTAGKYERPLAELMGPARFVLDTLSLDRLLSKYLESRTHLFVVLDEYGGVAGVVALEDVLEEILGKEILDESDQVEDLRELARQQRSVLTRRG